MSTQGKNNWICFLGNYQMCDARSQANFFYLSRQSDQKRKEKNLRIPGIYIVLSENYAHTQDLCIVGKCIQVSLDHAKLTLWGKNTNFKHNFHPPLIYN